MQARVLEFDREFDASGMPAHEICNEVRRRRWASFEMDTSRALFGDGRLIVKRISREALNRGL